MNKFLKLFDRPIAFHRCYVDLTGSVIAALFLTQAEDWQRSAAAQAGGWWEKTAEQWTDETGLSRREQENARKILKELGILHEKRAGAPAKLYFYIDRLKLDELLEATLA